jgi:hypothetical protein
LHTWHHILEFQVRNLGSSFYINLSTDITIMAHFPDRSNVNALLPRPEDDQTGEASGPSNNDASKFASTVSRSDFFNTQTDMKYVGSRYGCGQPKTTRAFTARP